MILQSLQKSRSPEKIYLIFSDRPPLPFLIDDYVREKLSPLKDIADDQFVRLKKLSLAYLLRSYGLNRIATSPHLRSTLFLKLKRQARLYQFKWQLDIDPKEIIKNILDSFETNSLLDQTSFALSLIRRHQNKSQFYLRSLFSHHHLDLSLLSSFSNEKEKIKNLLEKKVSHLSKPLDFKSKKRLFAFLARKGFAYDDIKTVIDESLSIS